MLNGAGGGGGGAGGGGGGGGGGLLSDSPNWLPIPQVNLVDGAGAGAGDHGVVGF
jgi:hypothetical protein